MADKEIKVHRQVIRMIFAMIQRTKNDRPVRRALPVYDNASSCEYSIYLSARAKYRFRKVHALSKHNVSVSTLCIQCVNFGNPRI